MDFCQQVQAKFRLHFSVESSAKWQIVLLFEVAQCSQKMHYFCYGVTVIY